MRVRTAISITATVLLATPLAALGVPPAFGPEAYLKASDTTAGDEFGSAVAIDGDTLVVGADGPNSYAGAVYVFVREDGGWSEQARLEPASPAATDYFGASVAISGDTIVVGAPGRGVSDEGTAVVFVRDEVTGDWEFQAELVADNKGSGDDFGAAVAIDGDTIVVGAPEEDSGAAAVPADDTVSMAGAAYVFVRNGATWTPEAYLKSSAPDARDNFGSSVDVHGDTVAVGVPFEDTGGADSGAVFVFTRAGTAWSQQALAKAPDAAAGDGFGAGVALHQETLVVGAPNKGFGGFAAVGAAYVFARSGESWAEEARLRSSDAAAEEVGFFGLSVGVDDGTVLVGAMFAGLPRDGGSGPGAAYAFSRTAGAWSEVARLENGVGDPSDEFGFSVAVSGDTLAVGAPLEDSGATGVDGNAEDESADAAGAAFVFVATDLPPEQTSTTPSGPTLVVDPATGVLGSAIRASVAGADPGIAFLWRLTDAPGAVLAEGDVTVDASGAGEFAVPVPRTATGVLTLELIDWGVRAEVVVGGPVPTAVAAGAGPGPQPTWLALSALLVTSVLAAGLLPGRRRAAKGTVGDTPAW